MRHMKKATESGFLHKRQAQPLHQARLQELSKMEVEKQPPQTHAALPATADGAADVDGLIEADEILDEASQWVLTQCVGDSVLVVGCGEGSWTNLLAGAGHRVLGIDH